MNKQRKIIECEADKDKAFLISSEERWVKFIKLWLTYATRRKYQAMLLKLEGSVLDQFQPVT